MAAKKVRDDDDFTFLIENAADPNILPLRGLVLVPVEHLVKTLTERFNGAFAIAPMTPGEVEDDE